MIDLHPRYEVFGDSVGDMDAPDVEEKQRLLRVRETESLLHVGKVWD